MAWIDVQILYDGTDITNQVANYDRDKSLCTSIGVARVTLKRNASITPVLYKSVVIIEGGHNKGTYWIHTIDKDIPSNTLTLNCQNGSIKLQDYFISDSYLVDYASTSDYWIKKFLSDAKVSYSFDSGDTGTLLSNNTSLGMCSAMDAIVPLLQQNAWYLSFDADDVAHIGTLSIDTGSPKVNLDDDTILDVQVTDHDKMFRNRAVVWGNANPTKHRWIYYDLDQHGKYANEYPGGHDVRSVVIANGNIKEGSQAAWIAQKAIKAFAHPQKEITLDVAGAVDVDTGDYVYVNSRGYRGKGIVTTEGSSMSSNGFVTHLVLNQECPKMFTFFDWGGYVYVGTQGNGVWRKPLLNHTWSNFSTGLTDLNITDLAVDSGAFACVSQGGTLFIRTDADTAWHSFHPTLTDSLTYSGQTTSYGNGIATACTFDKETGDIIAGFSLPIVSSSDPARSWIYYIHDASKYTGYQLQNEEGLTEFTIVDLDNNGTDDLVSVQIHSSGVDLLWNDTWHTGGYSYSNTNLITPSGAAVSGYMFMEIDDGTPARGYAWETQGVCGDGDFVYDIESAGSHGIGIFDPDGTIVTVQETNTLTGYVATQILHESHRPSTMDAGFVQAIGNRRLAYLEYYYKDGVKYNDTRITLHSLNFHTGEQVDYDIPGSILQDDVWLPLAALGKADGPMGRYYVLFGEKVGTNLKLCYMDFDHRILHTVATGAVPSSLAGGAFSTIGDLENRGFSFGDNLAFALQATYGPIGIDGDNVFANLPIIVFYHQESGVMYVNSSAASVFQGLGGDRALDWTSYLDFGAMLEDALYLAFWVDSTTFSQKCVLEFLPNGYATAIYGSATHFVTNPVGNKKHLYFTMDDGTGTYLNMLNVRARAIERTFPIGNVYTRAVSQLDDTDDSFYIYNAQNGHVTKYPASGVGSTDFDFNAKANLNDVINVYGDFPVVDFRSYASLVGDVFYLKNLAITDAPAGGAINYYGRNTTYAIYPSGERLMPKPYSILPGEGDMVLQGHKQNTYMTVLESSSTPFHLDASSNFPWAVWGNRSYSGYAFSGIDPWGWNQAQLWVSSAGSVDTYTAVILDALHSYIPDLRSCNMYSGYADPDESTYNRYLVFPQPTTNLPGAGGSNLLLVDMAQVYDVPGVIITSGTLNQSCTVLESFADYIDHVETTNTQDSPYIFVSKSGVPTKFYQRDGYSTMDYTTITSSGFVDRTTNLPTNYAINCIRAPDEI